MAARRDSDALPADVRAELRAGREVLGLSRDAFAALLGCSMQQVKRVELGWRTPSPDLECRWREATGLTPLEIFGSCERCGVPIAVSQDRRRVARFCSGRCRAEATFRPLIGKCRDCSVEVWRRESLGDRQGAAGPQLCGECKAQSVRRSHRDSARRREYRKRAGRPLDAERYTLLQIAERDGWKCHLCGGRVLKSVKVPHHRAATVDHLVPLSDGGADTLQNVALAHFICNTRRGVRGEAQLRLVP